MIRDDDGRLHRDQNDGSQIWQVQRNGTAGTLGMCRLVDERLYVVDKARQAKTVTTLGDAGTVQIVQTNGTRHDWLVVPSTRVVVVILVQRHEIFYHSHGFPRYRLVGSLPRISSNSTTSRTRRSGRCAAAVAAVVIVVRLSRNPKCVIGRCMQGKHACTRFASSRCTIFSRPMMLLLLLCLVVAHASASSTTTSRSPMIVAALLLLLQRMIRSRTTARTLRCSKVEVQQLRVGGCHGRILVVAGVVRSVLVALFLHHDCLLII